MDILELKKMIFFYENTVGEFTSENIEDLFSYYTVIAEENPKFEEWLKDEDLEKQWIMFSS